MRTSSTALAIAGSLVALVLACGSKNGGYDSDQSPNGPTGGCGS